MEPYIRHPGRWETPKKKKKIYMINECLFWKQREKEERMGGRWYIVELGRENAVLCSRVRARLPTGHQKENGNSPVPGGKVNGMRRGPETMKREMCLHLNERDERGKK